MGSGPVASLDERDALGGAHFVSSDLPRVGLDLDGSLESLGNSMTDLADALDETRGCELVRFHTRERRSSRAKLGFSFDLSGHHFGGAVWGSQ